MKSLSQEDDMKSQSSRWQGERRQVRHQQHANGTDSSSSHRVIFSEEWEEWGWGDNKGRQCGERTEGYRRPGLANAASSDLGQLQNRHLLVINTQDYGYQIWVSVSP